MLAEERHRAGPRGGVSPAAPHAGTIGRRTVFQVEREQRWRIWLLFGLLLALIAVAVWVACLIIAVAIYLTLPLVDTIGWVLRPRVVLLIVAISALAAMLYWFSAQIGARGRLLRALHGEPLDPGDRYHKRLADIVEEMRLATGAPRIECRVVPTLGLNAFAFSDLHGAGVIGVTEGALSRLSRQQLEAVVAHEFAHILSGDYVTVTVSCLLFGVYSAIAEELEDAMMATALTRAAPLALGALSLRLWLWLLQVASSVTTAALSREREREADTAAARYTRDPLSLAEALRVIGRHPGGAGSVPQGLAPLCIRASGESGARLFGLRRAMHPPLDERITALLALAHASPDEFERQAERAGEHFEEREHWATAPAMHAPAGVVDGALAAAVSSAACGRRAAGGTVVAPAPASGGALDCPSCGHGLEHADYEGMQVQVCRACGGRLAGSEQARRILARRDMGFTDEQQHLADILTADGDKLRRAANLARGRPGVAHIPCPRCGAPMMRGHYDYEHAVEVDRCLLCDLIWFEKDELEALQILTERRTG
jgi:Zn-dependent protease with chaperone function/Zn-finger nucleic acid-binding protein